MATLADIGTKLAALEAEGQTEAGLLQQLIALADTLSADLKAALAANDPATVQAIADKLDTDLANLKAAGQQMQTTITADTPPAS